MAISEKRYAAELIDRDGSVSKFDDISCMIRFSKERRLRESTAGWFVIDYRSQEWIDAGQAHFVKSDQIPSPMRGGLLGVKERSKAEELSAEFAGRIQTFDDLWK